MARLGEWRPPWTTRGRASFERVSVSHLRGGLCAEQVAKKARPEVWPAEDLDFVETQRGNFALSLVRDTVLELLRARPDPELETDEAIAVGVLAAADASGDDWDAVSLSVVERAVAGYLAVRDKLATSGQLPASRVVSDVVAFEDGPVPLELCAWGVWHIADGGALRELHLPRWQDADDVRLDDAQVGLAAMIAATGKVCVAKELKQWSTPYTAVTPQPPNTAVRVRIRVVGVLDATDSVRFDGTVDEAVAAFSSDAVQMFARLAGGSYRPSRSCAGCALRRHCPGLARRPGLLGTTGYSPATRSITPSDLTAHVLCPKRVWLQQDLGLPPARGDTAVQHRGQLVHAWLAAAHDRGITCSSADLLDPRDLDLGAPLPPDAGLALDLGWTAADYADALPYLAVHLDHCPMGAHVVTAVGEATLTAWDTDANVVVSTRVDLAYSTDDGRQHYRETKTIRLDRLPADETDLLAYFPQVALTLCFLADGPTATSGRVELELLGADAATVVPFDASDPVTVLAARTALADRVDRWLFDAAHKPRLDHCDTCPMSHVCPDARSSVEDMFRPATPSLLSLIDLDDVGAANALNEVGLVEDEEDFPF